MLTFSRNLGIWLNEYFREKYLLSIDNSGLLYFYFFFSPKFWLEYFGKKSKMCWQMLAVLASIFSFGVVGLLLQKVEFLHVEIFLSFFLFFLSFLEQLESVMQQWSEAKSSEQHQGRGAWRHTACFNADCALAAAHIHVSHSGGGRDCKWLTGIKFPCALRPNPSSTVRPGMSFGKAQAKSCWGQAGAEVNSSRSPWPGFWLTPCLCLTALCCSASCLSCPWTPGPCRRRRRWIFPRREPLSPARCGVGAGSIVAARGPSQCGLTLLHCVLIIYGNSERSGWGAKWSSSKNLLQGPSSRNSWRISWITKARLWSLFLQENPGMAHCFSSIWENAYDLASSKCPSCSFPFSH